MKRIDLPVVEMARRYEAGESTYALARAYGVCGEETVRCRLHAAGVKTRRRGWHKRAGVLNIVRGYLRTCDREGKYRRIHRACWEAYRGAIPGGYVVHHIDGDRMNNEIENLVCLPHGEHTRLHWRERRAT